MLLDLSSCSVPSSTTAEATMSSAVAAAVSSAGGKVAGKRPLRSLTAHEKLEAIKRVHEGESKASVARDIGVPESTLRGWCKNEEKITYISRQSSPVDTASTGVIQETAGAVGETASAPAASAGAASPRSAASSSVAESPTRDVPDEDCGAPPKEKKAKIAHEDGVVAPFNLSLKATSGGGRVSYSPNAAEIKYAAPVDFSTKTTTAVTTTASSIAAAATINNLEQQPKVESSSSASKAGGTQQTVAQQLNERERNRAELARLSVELGLNRPETSAAAMQYASATDLATSTANLSILTQWNNLLLQQAQQQQQQKKIPHSTQADTTQSATTTTNNLLASTSQLLLQTAAVAAAYNNQKNAHQVTSTQHLHPQHQHVDEKTKLAKLEPPKSVEESVWYWLKTQQAMLGLTSQPATSVPSQQQQQQPPAHQIHPQSHQVQQMNGGTSAAAAALLLNGDASGQTSWFWKWYKQYTQAAAQQQQQHQQASDQGKHLLYQQLVKDKDLNNENKCVISSTTAASTQPAAAGNKVRAVLDNLMLNNNNNNVTSVAALNGVGAQLVKSKLGGDKEGDDAASASTGGHQEALEHGEKFLKWLECCGEPSVTAMQIMQLRGLINNIKMGADRNAMPQRQKVRRK